MFVLQGLEQYLGRIIGVIGNDKVCGIALNKRLGLLLCPRAKYSSSEDNLDLGAYDLCETLIRTIEEYVAQFTSQLY